MKIRHAIVALAALLAGCVAGYTAIPAGPAQVEAIQLTVGSPWNQLPAAQTPFARKGAQAWTRDGVLLDRLLIIPAVPDKEPIFKERDKAAALPRFRADMLPNELVQLTESSLVKLLGEGGTIIKTANLRPTRFGERPGILFDISGTPAEGPTYKGLAGAFIADQKLYVLIFLGADPYYYDKHLGEAQAVIASARL